MTEPIFHVEWVDSALRQGWLDRDEAIAQGVVTVHSIRGLTSWTGG